MLLPYFRLIKIYIIGTSSGPGFGVRISVLGYGEVIKSGYNVRLTAAYVRDDGFLG